MSKKALSTAILDRPPQGLPILLDKSQAPSWTEAQREWSLTGARQDEGAPDFLGRCELCHQSHVNTLYELQNAVTTHTLWLGSECIFRWKLLDGQGTVDDNRQLWKRKQQRLQWELTMREFGQTDTLDPGLIRRFRHAVQGYFVDQWPGHGTLPDAVWERLVQLTTSRSLRWATPATLERIRAALFNPRALGLRMKPSRDDKPSAPKPPARVRTSLAHGAHTHDPGRQYD